MLRTVIKDRKGNQKQVDEKTLICYPAGLQTFIWLHLTNTAIHNAFFVVRMSTYKISTNRQSTTALTFAWTI